MDQREILKVVKHTNLDTKAFINTPNAETHLNTGLGKANSCNYYSQTFRNQFHSFISKNLIRMVSASKLSLMHIDKVVWICTCSISCSLHPFIHSNYYKVFNIQSGVLIMRTYITFYVNQSFLLP